MPGEKNQTKTHLASTVNLDQDLDPGRAAITPSDSSARKVAKWLCPCGNSVSPSIAKLYNGSGNDLT